MVNINRLNKRQLQQIISQYDVLVDNLQHQIILLKYLTLLQTPEIELKVPVKEIIKEVDFPIVSNFRRKDVAYA